MIENKGGGQLVVRAVVGGSGMGEGEPIEIQVAGNVEVFEPIPAGAAPGGKVTASSLPAGQHFSIGALHGTPAGVYEVVPWEDVKEYEAGQGVTSAAAVKGKHGVPVAMKVQEVVWVRNSETGGMTWVGPDLEVEPVGAPADAPAAGDASADPDDYDETGAFTTLGDLKPGEFFKSAKGAVWQVGEEQAGQVKVTKLEDGKEAWGATSMPTTKIVPKVGTTGGFQVGDTVTWEAGDKFPSGVNKTGKVIGFESGSKGTNVKVETGDPGDSPFYVVTASKLTKVSVPPRPHDPDEWETDADVPAHELEPGDLFSLAGVHYVVEKGPPPAALGAKYADDPEWGWVTKLSDGKSVAYKNSPGETGDKLLTKLKPKAPQPVFSAGEQMFSQEGEPLFKGKTVWLTGPNAGTAVVPKGSGNAPGTVEVEFQDGSTAPYPPGELTTTPPGADPAANAKFLMPNENGVTVGDLDVGDHFLDDDGIVWEIESVNHAANSVTASNVAVPQSKQTFLGDVVPAEVPQEKSGGGYTTYQPGQEIDDLFGPPPPQEDMVVNDAGIQLSQLAVGDHFGFDDAYWEVVEVLDSAVVGRNLETNEMLEWLPDDVPEEVPSYQVAPAGPVPADLAVLSTEFFSKGPLPVNAAQVKLSELPAGSLVQMEPEMLASGPAEKAVWRVVGPVQGGVQTEIAVPAGGGYPPGHKHVFGPDQVFERAITPAAMGAAKDLGVPWMDPSDYGHAVPPEPVPPSTTSLIGVAPNITNLSLGDLPVGALAQEVPTSDSPKPAVWRVTGHEGGHVQMEIIEPSGSTHSTLPVGHKLDFDPDKVFPRVQVPQVPGPVGEPGTIGALEPGDHFLKGGVVYQVEGPAPNLEGSHVRANSVTPVGVTPGAVDTVDYPVGTNVVKVPPPAGAGPELAGGPTYSQATPPAELLQFPEMADVDFAVTSEPVADLPIGVRFKIGYGAKDTYRVVGETPEGAILVVTNSSLEPFEFPSPDIVVWRADTPGEYDLPPLKPWVEFALGDEAWTLGGKHGHFESPETGPSAFEKVFLIDGDPTPHQFTSELYIADPFGGPPAAGSETAGVTPLTSGDLKVGDVFTMPEHGFGLTYKVTEPGWAESLDGTTKISLTGPASIHPVEIVRPVGGDKVEGGSYPVDQLEKGDLVQYDGAEWVITQKDQFGAILTTLPTAGDASTGVDLDQAVDYLGPSEYVTPVSDLPVGAEFEDMAGDKWAVTSAGAVQLAEPIGQEDEGLEQEFSDELVKVLHAPGAPSLEGGKPGDSIEMGGATYKIVADTGDGYSVETLSGAPAGTISKSNTAATLVPYPGQFLSSLEVGDHFMLDDVEYEVTEKPPLGPADEPEPPILAHELGSKQGEEEFDPGTVVDKVEAKGEADVAAGKGKLSLTKVLEPYSAKSKSGGGYFFADLDNMEPGDEFTDKTGTVYVVRGKSANGYHVRFHKKGDESVFWQAPAGSRVKLPK